LLSGDARGHANRCPLTCAADDDPAEIKKVLAVGQKAGPALNRFTSRLIELGDGAGCAAQGRDPMERTASIRGKDDHPVSVPGAATTVGRVAQRERWPACRFDLFELPIREESNGAAVRRPEWKRGALSARERLRRERIEGTHPEESFALRRCRNESQTTAIGRDGDG
jgi:hypothetical protein